MGPDGLRPASLELPPRPVEAFMLLHELAKQVADELRDGGILFGHPDACPSRHYFRESIVLYRRLRSATR